MWRGSVAREECTPGRIPSRRMRSKVVVWQSHLHIVSFLQLQKLKLNTWVFGRTMFFLGRVFFPHRGCIQSRLAMPMILRNVFQKGRELRRNADNSLTMVGNE